MFGKQQKRAVNLGTGDEEYQHLMFENAIFQKEPIPEGLIKSDSVCFHDTDVGFTNVLEQCLKLCQVNQKIVFLMQLIRNEQEKQREQF
nr:hypothetical protein SPAC16E8.18c - fission yeast (Schizosaccharomyces pombe) [Schizosaccharomyces pombe]